MRELKDAMDAMIKLSQQGHRVVLLKHGNEYPLPSGLNNERALAAAQAAVDSGEPDPLLEWIRDL